ncbi:MAG: HAD-IIB family hydrolase [Frankiales bacterium]|nr:HAD-IIB family hydrolase [Frankiales bacterium]
MAAGVRLLATDLDGTLLRPDGSVSATTVEVFARARAAGFPLVFVTGRPPRWLPVVAAATGHGGAAICANGGVVLDLETHEILRSHPIDPEVIDEVVRTLRAQLPGVGFAAEWVEEGSGAVARDTDFAHETAYVPRVTAAGAVVGADIRAVTAGHRVVKLLARAAGTGHDADSLLDHALEHVEHLVAVTHSNSADVLLEMSALGVDKGAALAEHAAGLGLAAADVAAAGDMPNDVPMLRWAGVGLGVAGAHPRVLEVADAVLPGPSDDGVAQFLDAVLAARG